MLLPIYPLPFIAPPIWPLKLALSFFSVFRIEACVHSAIGPSHVALAMHLAGHPLSLVNASVMERVCTLTIHDVINKLPTEGRAVRRSEQAMSMFLPVPILALEVGAVRPSLEALATFRVVFPVPLVGRAIGVQKLASAVRLVIQPLAFIKVTVGMPEFSKAASTVLSKLAIVHAAVRARHNAMSMSVATQPLASVDPATLELYSPISAAWACAATEVGQLHSGGLRHLEPHGRLHRNHAFVVHFVGDAAGAASWGASQALDPSSRRGDSVAGHRSQRCKRTCA
mmetsp:Transcript_160220/g.283861  ORF Transcript_160220/g.283861 Transcript_160220/m.283861 type:complete len:284 (+) Transcript_160220:150-1001(+)